MPPNDCNLEEFNSEKVRSYSLDNSISRIKHNRSCALTRNGQYRIVVMGAAGVGKTSIISQFLYKTFDTQYRATVEDLHQGQYEINGLPVNLNILDTSGTYEFPAMRQLSISTGDAFILVYSVQDESSFEEVIKLRNQILDQKTDRFIPIVIVGNKSNCTKEKQISRHLMVNIDWENGFIEASAKNNINIEDIFQELLTQANVPYVLKQRRESCLGDMSRKNICKKIWKRTKINSCFIS
jgi:small GTP-binding protein